MIGRGPRAPGVPAYHVLIRYGIHYSVQRDLHQSSKLFPFGTLFGQGRTLFLVCKNGRPSIQCIICEQRTWSKQNKTTDSKQYPEDRLEPFKRRSNSIFPKPMSIGCCSVVSKSTRLFPQCLLLPEMFAFVPGNLYGCSLITVVALGSIECIMSSIMVRNRAVYVGSWNQN